MKIPLAALLSLLALSSHAAAGASGDIFSGAAPAAFSLQAALAEAPEVPGLRQAPQRAPALSQAEKDAVLRGMDPEKWTAVSDQPYASWWMPRKFWPAEGGFKVDVLTSVMGGRDTIPLRRSGDRYEYGPWYYCHSSVVEERCIFRVRVQFEVVSAELLQGTLFLELHVDGSREERPFSFRKK